MKITKITVKVGTIHSGITDGFTMSQGMIGEFGDEQKVAQAMFDTILVYVSKVQGWPRTGEPYVHEGKDVGEFRLDLVLRIEDHEGRSEVKRTFCDVLGRVADGQEEWDTAKAIFGEMIGIVAVERAWGQEVPF